MPSQTIHFTAEQFAALMEDKPPQKSVSEHVRDLVAYGLECEELSENVESDERTGGKGGV